VLSIKRNDVVRDARRSDIWDPYEQDLFFGAVQRLNQSAGGWKEPHLLQKTGLEDFALRTLGVFCSCIRNSGNSEGINRSAPLLLEQQMPRNAAMGSAESFVPGNDVEFVAVDHRAVYVEEDSLAGGEKLAGVLLSRDPSGRRSVSQSKSCLHGSTLTTLSLPLGSNVMRFALPSLPRQGLRALRFTFFLRAGGPRTIASHVCS
jgi:hypothetical protein